MIIEKVLKSKEYSIEIDGQRYCLLKIPFSDNMEIRNSFVAYLLRNIDPETREGSLEFAKEIAEINNNFKISCPRTGIKKSAKCEGCRTLRYYENRLTPEPEPILVS